MTTKSNRHAMVEVRCMQCGTMFLARKQRVDMGLGKFCSQKCTGEFKTQNVEFGFSKGKKYWDGTRWAVHWRDAAGIHVTTYANWWWRMNVGEVPDGHWISHKDGDHSNISPSNFECITKRDARGKGGKSQNGKPKPWIAREKSKWWRGGSSYEGYPTQFSKPLKRRIKIRDAYTCQACNSVYPSQQLDVHHVDRNLENNDEHNLVTLCRSCHSAVHGKSQKSNDKIRYYQSLLPK